MPRNQSNADEVAEYDGGKATGQRWVTKLGAPREELARLAEFYQGICDEEFHGWFSDDGYILSAYSTAERLYFVITPDHDGDRDEAQSFWEFVARPYDMADITASFVEGFVEGALEAWDEANVKV